MDEPNHLFGLVDAVVVVVVPVVVVVVGVVDDILPAPTRRSLRENESQDENDRFSCWRTSCWRLFARLTMRVSTPDAPPRPRDTFAHPSLTGHFLLFLFEFCFFMAFSAPPFPLLVQAHPNTLERLEPISVTNDRENYTFTCIHTPGILHTFANFNLFSFSPNHFTRARTNHYTTG